MRIVLYTVPRDIVYHIVRRDRVIVYDNVVIALRKRIVCYTRRIIVRVISIVYTVEEANDTTAGRARRKKSGEKPTLPRYPLVVEKYAG